MESTFVRKRYLNKVKPYIGKGIIKVLTGQRRVGKTTLLRQIMELILKENKKTNTIYINKEHNEFKHIKVAEDLFKYVKSKLSKSKPNCVFIDEVQEIEEFEVALRQLLVEGIDIYCTGSNANMLSGDLATHLSGRYIEFHINSLSFSEFLQIHKLENDSDALNKFIRYGGLPYLIHLPFDDEIVYGYLKSIYNTIILKDIVSRYNIRDIDFLERLVEYMSDNLGSYVSSKKISDFLKAQRVSLSVNTVMNYLKYLTNSFFINKVQRLDIIGKKRFEINDKYFFSDLGLKHSIIPFTGEQIGQVFENLVYNHLICQDYEVFIGKHQDREIDFVAQKGNETKYIQVAYLLPNKKVREREFGNLLKIEDNYEKIVVSADEFSEDFKGIKHIHIREFLANEDF
ncbi:MAG: ATP-binding protein [Flavobacteriales bacterium]|nr:ATP-binding protein [Flavobacteriales bacterium]